MSATPTGGDLDSDLDPGPDPDPASYPPAEVVIGLDIGTTATKAVAFGLGSAWRTTVVREYPLLAPRPGWQVQDPVTVLAAVMGALAEVATQCRGARVAGISVSAAMHGLIGLDAELRPLTPLLTWADSRATAEAAELRGTPEGIALHRTSGTPIHPMSPLTKLLWFARHEPELGRRVRAWVGLKDFVLHALTGTLATELSSASGTGLLDLSSRGWNPAALDLAGVTEDQLPPVLPTTAVLGLTKTVAHRLGLAVATPVVVGAADGPLGNLGTGALGSGVVGLSIGTSGAARMVVPAAGRQRLRHPVLLRVDRGCLGRRRRGQQRRHRDPVGRRSVRPHRAAPTPSCSSWLPACRRAATAWSCSPTCWPSERRCGTPP